MFVKLFLDILKSTSHFEHFAKEDDPHILCIFNIRDCEKGG